MHANCERPRGVRVGGGSSIISHPKKRRGGRNETKHTVSHLYQEQHPLVTSSSPVLFRLVWWWTPGPGFRADHGCCCCCWLWWRWEFPKGKMKGREVWGGM